MTDSAILTATLPPTTQINGLRLLELAHPDNGHVVLFWPELCELWQCAPGTARRHLGLLHQAGVVHYSTNGDGCAYITFRHLSRVGARNPSKISTENARGRAVQTADEAAEQPFDARGISESARGISENARGRAESVEKIDVSSHAHAGAQLVGWLVGSIDQSDPEPTNQPAAAPEPAPTEPVATPPTVEAAVAAAGLLRVRMRGDQAKAIAANVPLPIIREAVGAWWTGRKAVGGQYENQPGLVVTWLREWHRTGATPWPDPPASWEHDPLCELMRTPAEKDARAAAEQAARDAMIAADEEWASSPPAAAAPPLPPKPKPQPGTAEAYWAQLQADFALHQPAGGVDGILRDSRVIDYTDGAFTVALADGERVDWAEKKLRNQVKRRLAVIMGRHDIDVTFRAATAAEEQS